MKFSIKHLLFVVFLFAFALGVRSFAIAIENDIATGIGVLVAAFIASCGLTAFGTRLSVAWLIGALTTLTMCVVDTIERAYQSPAMEYLWRDPYQVYFATNIEFGIIITVVFTFLATIISGLGVQAGILLNTRTANRRTT